ncbi:hypothetical protein TKK_0006072 [Trichogramma kaykai]
MQSGRANEGQKYDNECEKLKLKDELERSKHYLQQICPSSGDSLSHHLNEVLTKILKERPKDAIASFEKYSRELRAQKFSNQNRHLRDLYEPPPAYDEAKRLVELFKISPPGHGDYHSISTCHEDEESLVEMRQNAPDLQKLFYYFQQVGVALPRDDIVYLGLSIRKLIAKEKIKNVRFWGKIIGNPRNYYIIEASLTDEELQRRLEEAEVGSRLSVTTRSCTNESQELAENVALEQALATSLLNEAREAESIATVDDKARLQLVYPPMPKNPWQPTPEVAPEKIGTGANAKVYFVCNRPGLDGWTELPPVTPAQIVVARQTVYMFSGTLGKQVHTYPPFPGCEKNYLRAQIARIEAATHCSPLGYFTFGRRGARGEKDNDEFEQEDEEDDDDEEDDGEEEEGGDIVINRHYEQPALKDLIDPSMCNWCHHSPYLLKQGRTVWLEPGKTEDEVDNASQDEYEGEDESEEGMDDDNEEERRSSRISRKAKELGYEKEIGPPLLTSLSEDVAADGAIPWSARLSSSAQPDVAVALLRSNIWPGAYTFAADKCFGNVYIGWGTKREAYNYSPPAMPPVQDQYVPASDLEFQEETDPTPADEEAWRISQLPPERDDGSYISSAEEEGLYHRRPPSDNSNSRDFLIDHLRFFLFLGPTTEEEECVDDDDDSNPDPYDD